MIRSWQELTFVGGVARAEGLELRLSSESVSIESGHGATVLRDPSVCGVGQGIKVWWNRGREVLVIGAQLSEEVLYSVLLTSDQISPIDYLFRYDDEDLRFVIAQPADDGSLVLLYERGLLCVTEQGTLRWHRLHDDLSADLLSAKDGVVVIETQWPDEDAGKRGLFRLADGEELVERPPAAAEGSPDREPP